MDNLKECSEGRETPQNYHSFRDRTENYLKRISVHCSNANVAERTSYFCLARKIIWPLGSTHIFIQWGWLILFNPNHFSGQHQIGEGPPNTLFLRTFSNRTDVITVRSPFSSSIMTPWGKPSNLWTSWVYSFRPRVPSWLQIRWIQSATNRNHFKSPSTLAMLTAMTNSTQTSSYFIPGQNFLETFRLLSLNDQDHTFMGDYIIPVLNQQTWPLLYLWWRYITHTFNNALTLTMHILLRHLATKTPLLFPSFLPSFLWDLQQKRKPLFHAAIKTIIKTSWHLRSSLLYLP